MSRSRHAVCAVVTFTPSQVCDPIQDLVTEGKVAFSLMKRHTGGWGEQLFPLCVGHEIVGRAIRVGPKVTLIKEGQRVGIGALSYACLECKQCKDGNEAYCAKQFGTYGFKWPDTGIVSQGGYSSHVRAHEYFVFPIPDAIPSALAAPMLCAGLTAYSPLVRNGVGPGKKIGILGIGGIGHFGIIFAKALGAEVWAISRSRSKEMDALQLGADGFIATSEPGWEQPHRLSFEFILNTASSTENFDLAKFLGIMDVHGRFISVGLPEEAGQRVKTQDLVDNGVLIGASHLGSRTEALQMLKLAAEKNLKGWIEEIPTGEAGIAEAVTKLKDHQARYRYTLVGHREVFGTKGRL
jgi:alcohol dehydrogenase (NADP+)